VVDPEITTFFNKIYDQTYRNVFAFVTSKCGNTNDIADILQETYMEVYLVTIKKGCSYIKNEEAFVKNIAKTKIYRHYSLKEKISSFFAFTKDEQEIDLLAFAIADDIEIEESVANKLLIDDINDFLKKKPQLTQKVFFLFYYFDHTIQQIAKELCLSESNVKNKLYRTVKEIRELYGKDG